MQATKEQKRAIAMNTANKDIKEEFVQWATKDVKKTSTNDLTFEDFCLDRKTIDAVIRNFEIIGEASKQLSEELKLKNADIPWKEMIGTRNRIIHEYADVDLGIVWSIIELELEDLKAKLNCVINDLSLN